MIGSKDKVKSRYLVNKYGKSIKLNCRVSGKSLEVKPNERINTSSLEGYIKSIEAFEKMNSLVDITKQVEEEYKKDNVCSIKDFGIQLTEKEQEIESLKKQVIDLKATNSDLMMKNMEIASLKEQLKTAMSTIGEEANSQSTTEAVKKGKNKS